MFFKAILYRARTGVPWRDLPAEFGAWDAVDNRLRRRLKKLPNLMAERTGCDDARRRNPP